MKKLLIIPAVLAVAACQPKQNNGPSDALSFGLLGDVKEVYVTQSIESSTDEDLAEIVPTTGEERLEFTYDADGRITLDTFGLPYEYDADGAFVGGSGKKTTLERDAKGRIVSYDNTHVEDEDDYEDLDIESFFSYVFDYDNQNRVVKEEISGWEWCDTYEYTYEGDKPYPASATFVSGAEGWNEEGDIKFEYTAFDDKGNWTERLETYTVKAYEEGFEEEAQNYTTVYKKVRRFVYWSE